MEGRRDHRMLLEAEHQKHWIGPNTNRAVDKKQLTSDFEKECQKLRDLGIDEEELKIYHCSINSPIDNVDKLNKAIVNKLNDIAGCRRHYFWSYTNRANKELHNIKKSIYNLKKEIKDDQHKIHEAGGVSEKVPALFNKPVRV